MCATVAPSVIEFVIIEDVEFDLIALMGGVKKKKHAEKNRSTRFSNCADFERKNGSQFLGFIYKR